MKLLSLKSLVRHESKGFSLFEVTVAVAILSIAIAMIIQLYSMNLKSTRKAERYTEAVILARSALDEIMSSDDLEESTKTETVHDRYEVDETVTGLPGNEKDLAQTYEITVHVTWKEGSVELKARKSVVKTSDNK